MREYADIIRNEGISPDIISMMIDDHKQDRERMLRQYERYKATLEGVPILRRDPVEYEDFETGTIKRIDNKVNNRLNNSFDAEIVDTKIGYMFGHAISYEVADKEQDQTLLDLISDFNIRSMVEDADSELGKKAAIAGYSARLAYIDTEGEARIANLEPWETILIGDITEPEYALRYYETVSVENKAKVKINKAYFYDGTHYHLYQARGQGTYEFVERKPHLFDYCPVWGVPNNAEMMGDAEKVYELIDAYDRTLSDASNEIEQYRLAYLVLKGMGADEEDLERLRKTGVFNLYDEKDDVNYLTKDINDTMIENHLDRLEENIMRFAKSVNFSDESFGTSLSGVAMKFKLMALENKCITMERKFSAALRYQFKVLCSAWAKKNAVSKEDYLKVWFQFKRNLPVNLKEEAEVQQLLKGFVSERTRLAQFSQVDDVQFELDEMEKEANEYMNNYPPVEGEGNAET